MTTICSFCGKEIEEVEGKKYLSCKRCHRGMTPVGSNSYLKLKGGSIDNKMAKKSKREYTGPVIVKMIKEGKTNEEILKEVVCKKTYITMIRYKLKKGILK